MREIVTSSPSSGTAASDAWTSVPNRGPDGRASGGVSVTTSTWQFTLATWNFSLAHSVAVRTRTDALEARATAPSLALRHATYRAVPSATTASGTSFEMS